MGAHNGWREEGELLEFSMPLAMSAAAAGGGSRKCAADSQKASIPLDPMLLKAKQFLFSRDG